MTLDLIADLEQQLAWTIAEGGDVTDLHAAIHAARTDRQINAAILAGTVTQAIADREHPGARTEPRHTYLAASDGCDLDGEWTVRICYGRRRYTLTLPVEGATRWTLFHGSPDTGRYLGGLTSTSTPDEVADWAAAAIRTDNP